MRYGKLIDGGLMYAPGILEVDGLVHYHPSEAMYQAAGFLPVVDIPRPENPDTCYASHWEEQGGQIVKVWIEAEPPFEQPVEQALEDRVGTLEAKVEAIEVDYADKSQALNILMGVTT